MAMAGLRDELETLRRLAQEGDPVAQFNMGVRYAEGQGVPLDFIEAARWYSAAADQGDAPAQFNLGLLFYQGQGVERNLDYAYELFRLAALQGDSRARAGLDAVLLELDNNSRERLLRQFPLPTSH
jgi:TPR repeat protein